MMMVALNFFLPPFLEPAYACKLADRRIKEEET